MQPTIRPAAYAPALAARPPVATPPPAGLAGRATPRQTFAGLQPLLERFAPISLSEMDAVALQNRTDTKYLLSTGQLAVALRALAGQYRALEIGGVRLSPYQTLYFDTADFALYMQHHAGKRNRYKLRSRRYQTTGQSFLELKLKNTKARTIKQRIATAALVTARTPEVASFVAAHAPDLAGELEPRLWNEFTRITLVGAARPERLTIDVGLSFHWGGRRVSLPGIAIAEVKQEGVERASSFMQQMHAAAIQPTSFSKYCIGVALLYPHVKHNAFKPSLRLIEKLIGDPRHD